MEPHDSSEIEPATTGVAPSMLKQPRREDPFPPPADAAPLARRADVVRGIEDRPGQRTQDVARVVVRHSDDIAQLMAALAAAQCMEGYGDIEKSRTARIEGKQSGVKFEYDYETLADVLAATRPFLGKSGIALLQFPFPSQASERGGLVVTIRTMLAHGSGQWIYNDLTASVENGTPQAIGSGITYLRRYAAKSILGVSAEDEDDDGAGASRATPPIQRGQRVSEQRQAPPAHVGRVQQVAKKDGGAVVTLDSGWTCATRDAEMVEKFERAKEAGRPVDVTAEPSRVDAKKYAPTVVDFSFVAD